MPCLAGGAPLVLRRRSGPSSRRRFIPSIPVRLPSQRAGRTRPGHTTKRSITSSSLGTIKRLAGYDSPPAAALPMPPAMVGKKLPAAVLKFFRDEGSKGGKKRSRNLTPEQRSEVARKATGRYAVLSKAGTAGGFLRLIRASTSFIVNWLPDSRSSSSSQESGRATGAPGLARTA